MTARDRRATAGQPAGAAQTAQPPQRREPGQPVESPQPGTAGSPASPSSATTDPRAPKRPLPAPTSHTTRHTQDINGEQWTYDATLATLHVETKKVAPASSVFHADFIALPDGAHPDPTRPVTFLFNGGPAAHRPSCCSARWGPRRISWQDPAPDPTAAPTAAPYGLIDNPQSLLPQSDLVFIDAPGAGFSEIAEEAKAELWSVDGDVAAFVQFIQRWLSANGRWNSPKYVFGESYGTVRGSVLSYALLDAGIALNGLVLLSDILDYGHIVGTDDQAYIGYFPTYAAIAHYTGGRVRGRRAASGPPLGPASPRTRATPVHQGSPGPGRSQTSRRCAPTSRRPASSPTERCARRSHAVTAWHAAMRRPWPGGTPSWPGCRPSTCCARTCGCWIRASARSCCATGVWWWDATTGACPASTWTPPPTTRPSCPTTPSSAPPTGPWSTPTCATNSGGTGTQERRAFSEMDWESTEPGKGWVWQHKQPGHTKTMWDQTLTYPQVMPDLASALVRNPRLKVLVANGYFDLATPFSRPSTTSTTWGCPHPCAPTSPSPTTRPGTWSTRAGLPGEAGGGPAGVLRAGAGAGGAVGTGTATVPVDLSDLDERPELPPLDLG
ncbi:hypothetical protein FAM22021_002149 [Propionibacterium freudenreichii]|nr:hypothetical protein [Propionibacterium freudenreichii]